MEKESTNANSMSRLWMFPCFWKNVEIFLVLFSIFQSFPFSVNRIFKKYFTRIIFERSESGISQVCFAEHTLKTFSTVNKNLRNP